MQHVSKTRCVNEHEGGRGYVISQYHGSPTVNGCVVGIGLVLKL